MQDVALRKPIITGVPWAYLSGNVYLLFNALQLRAHLLCVSMKACQIHRTYDWLSADVPSRKLTLEGQTWSSQWVAGVLGCPESRKAACHHGRPTADTTEARTGARERASPMKSAPYTCAEHMGMHGRQGM